MRRFQFLKHTADAKFRAYGRSIEEAFMNSAFAMASLMYDPKRIKPEKEEKIEVKGKDICQLLYSFLEELIFLQDSRQFIMHSFAKPVKIRKSGNKLILSAAVAGDSIKALYNVRAIVKAVTYNEMEISEKPIYAQVVVDI